MDCISLLYMLGVSIDIFGPQGEIWFFGLVRRPPCKLAMAVGRDGKKNKEKKRGA